MWFITHLSYLADRILLNVWDANDQFPPVNLFPARSSIFVAGAPMDPQKSAQATVYVIDNNLVPYAEIIEQLQKQGVLVETFRSFHSFFLVEDFARPCCIITDATVNQVSAIELQRLIRDQHGNLPVIYYTAYIDIDTAMRLMENGAVTIQKRSTDTTKVLEYVTRSLQNDAKQHSLDEIYQRIKQVLQILTSRQKRVLESIVAGTPTKKIALQLGMSQRLVEKERSEILKHFQVSATPDVTFLIGEYLAISEMRFQTTFALIPGTHVSSLGQESSFGSNTSAADTLSIRL